MPTMHIGASGSSRPRPRYTKKLSFAELEFRPPAPTPKTLGRWRSELGAGFTVALVAPPSLFGERDWPLRDAAKVQAEFDRLKESAAKLKPRAIVLRTPAAIRPGTVALKRFIELAVRVKKLAPVCVWEPQGVWEHDEAREAVAGAGIVVASDPLRDDIEGEEVVYARLRGLGGDRRYHEGRLQDLADKLSGVSEAFVVFATEQGFAEATRMLSVLAQMPEPGEALEEEDEEGLEFEGDEGEEGDEDSGDWEEADEEDDEDVEDEDVVDDEAEGLFGDDEDDEEDEPEDAGAGGATKGAGGSNRPTNGRGSSKR